MSDQRHVLRRFESGRTQDFDEQFWPVVLALCVLSALTVGTILTLLRGPWMWGSLLALPILLGLSLLGLSFVEHRFWRRSIQVALLLSFAFHLFILIVAYRTEIFSGRPPTQLAQTRSVAPIPQLEISVTPTEEFWNQPNDLQTPETEVANERQQNTTTRQPTVTQAAIADAAQANPNPRLERRESTSETTPQAGQALSQKSRRLDSPSRQSRELTVATSAPAAKADAAKAAEITEPDQVDVARKSAAQPEAVLRRQTDPEASEQALQRDPQRREQRETELAVAAARQPRRTAQIQPQPTTSPAEPAAALVADASIENAHSEVPAADVAATRRDPAPSLTRNSEDRAEPQPIDRQIERAATTQIADAMAAPTASKTSQRQSQARAPAETAVVEDRTQATEPLELQVQPSPESSQIARQTTSDRQLTLNPESSEQIERTPADQSAREHVRRAQPVERPSDLPTTNLHPRLARDVAPAPTTIESLEAPANATSSGQPSPSASEAKPLALSRSTIGTAGSGATPNFGRAADSAASPAQLASDSARREQATSNAEGVVALSPSQASEVSRSRAGLDAARASLPATASTADRAAGKDPQPIDASAAAAVSSATAANRRSEISADVGSADLDLGSTKIVSGAARRESAGGGQPEQSTQPPAASRAGQRGGQAIASIVADVVSDATAANLTEGAGRPATTNAEPNARAAVAQRRGATQPRASGPSRGELAGQPSETSSADSPNRTTAARRAERADRGGEGDSSLNDEQPAEVRRASAARKTLVDGPSTDGQPGGLAQQSTAARTSRDPESARSEISRSNYSDSISAVSPALARSEDGLAGTNPNASNSMQRRSENASQSAGEPRAMASSPDRTIQNLQLEIASGTEGAEFDRGMNSQVASSETEPTALALDSQRASGRGQSSLGPTARNEESLSATAEPLVEGNGRARAESAPAESTGESVTASRPRRGTGSSLDNDASTALMTADKPGVGTIASRTATNDQVSTAQRTERSEARIDIDWDIGAGGLGQHLQPELGVASRRASRNSTVVAVDPDSRFRRRDASGELSLSPNAVVAKEAFMGRSPSSLSQSGPQTEQAIEAGLAFLIRNQQADGHWSLLGFDENHPLHQWQMDSDTAATGLALLAFQGAGYTHREFKYADRLDRAVAWLVRNQRPDGNLYVESDKQSDANCQLYSHGIAALALTEAYGMTQDPAIREAAQKSIDFIVATQDPKLGGWRYFSEPGRRSTDTSVTGWMVMALHSARLAGLKVDSKVWTGVDDWLETAQSPDSESQFVYNPHVEDDPEKKLDRSHLRRAANSTTAVGLLMRMYTGWNRDDPRLLEGANVLLNQLPTELNPEVRDTYYWYYATQVLRHVGGSQWQTWNQTLHPLLLSTQVPDGALAGSWSPFTPVEDKWAKNGGRLYLTTLNLLSLEVDYRLLPLYEKTVAPQSK